MKILIALMSMALSSPLLAKTPAPALFGVGSQTWIQHGLLVTPRAMDLAIQGPGFFLLRDAAGRSYLTRHGSFAADKEGFIVYRDSDRRLLSASLRPIKVSAFVETQDGAVGKSFVIKGDGSLSFAYTDGTIRGLKDKIGVALLGNYKAITRVSEHHFLVNDEKAVFVGAAGEETRGVIYQSSLEELDAHAYFLFENNADQPSDFAADGYEIEAEGRFEGGSAVLTSKRVRLVEAKDQWWQLSADDRLIWYGKLSVKGDVATMKSMALPTDYSCAPTQATVTFKLEEGVELRSSGDTCSSSLKIQVKRRIKSEEAATIVE